jgi:hypothetical protein
MQAWQLSKTFFASSTKSRDTSSRPTTLSKSPSIALVCTKGFPLYLASLILAPPSPTGHALPRNLSPLQTVVSVLEYEG